LFLLLLNIGSLHHMRSIHPPKGRGFSRFF